MILSQGDVHGFLEEGHWNRRLPPCSCCASLSVWATFAPRDHQTPPNHAVQFYDSSTSCLFESVLGTQVALIHDDVMTWRTFILDFVRGIHRSTADSLHKRPVMQSFDFLSCWKIDELLVIWDVMTLMWCHCNDRTMCLVRTTSESTAAEWKQERAIGFLILSIWSNCFYYRI